MASVNIKQEVAVSSPALTQLTSAGSGNHGDVSPEKSFNAMQELVLADEKRGKEKENNNFQNLMEYREAPASPSASSVTTTLSLENCGSPSTPNSNGQDVQDMDDERLPNELLDELYEDMGMKEGMELDFVEFLMEQDMVDPQTYMTPEALRTSGFPTPSASGTNSVLTTPTNVGSRSDSNWTGRNCGSPSFSIASSTNVTVNTSSGSSSPVSKRFHMSNSGPSSPVRTNPPSTSTSHMGSHIFKAPLTPPTARRPLPNCQGAASPSSNLSVGSSHSGQSSNHSSVSNQSSCQGNSLTLTTTAQSAVPPRCYSPRNTQAGGVPSPQLPHSTTGTFAKPPPQYAQFVNKTEAPASPLSCGAPVSKTPTNQQTLQQQSYHRLGRPPPPNVNVQNFPQNNGKWMSSQNGAQPQPQPTAGSQPSSQGIGNQSCAVNASAVANQTNIAGNQGNVGRSVQNNQGQYGRPLDSPLDQGYMTSSDSMSVRSYQSSGISTVPTNNMTNSMQSPSVGQKQQLPMGHPTGPAPKSVHFAEGINNIPRQPSTEGLPYEPQYRTNVPDCELEEYRNSIQKHMQSKMMPRHHHNKPDIAPYVVPSNNGQSTMNPFDYHVTPTHSNNMASPAVGMQQFEYPQKPSNGSYGMDNNQNLVMPNYNESISAPQTSITNMNCQIQQQQPQQQQQQSSCSGPMTIPPQQQQQQQMDPYRSQQQCQIQDPAKGSMFDPMMQNNMCKTNGPAQIQGDPANCQFPQQGNMNNNCGMMGINQGMMGNPNGAGIGHNRQGSIEQDYHGQQGYQGYGPNQQNMASCGNDGRPMHMGMNMTSGQGNMGYDQQQYDQQNRAMPGGGNMNMNNQMYPPNPQGGNMVAGSDGGMGGMGTQGWNNGMPGTPQGPHQMGNVARSAPMNMPGQSMQMQSGQCGQMTGVPCTLQNCANCKNGSPNKPQMMSSQQRFIQHLITDRSNAFRSHPLFPLLRDLIIADMNFSTPNFPYQLISNLPADFDKLLQNFLHRNPPAGNYQTNFAVESVVMDALKYAHHCLIDKIRQKQDQDVDKHSKSTSKSLSAIEEFCEKFDQSVRKSIIKPATFQLGNHGNGMVAGTMGGAQMPSGSMGPPDMGTPTKDMKFSMGNIGPMMMAGGMFNSPMAKKELDFQHMMSPNFKSLKDLTGMDSDTGSMVSSSSHSSKTESKKHPSLPKESVAIMLDWLRQHKDNPYPNDDEKAMLIKQTGLTINQINYWFTNARRRILPKWAQSCK